MVSADLITQGLALMAFVVAFYTLVARERKTPYIINFIYPAASLIIMALILATLAQTLKRLNATVEFWLRAAGTLFFGLAVFKVISMIWRLHNRQVHFRDDRLLKNLKFVRYVRHKWRKSQASRSYEHNAPTLDETLLQEALATTGQISSQQVQDGLKRMQSDRLPRSMLVALVRYPLLESDQFVSTLIAHLLEKNWYVQYTTCIRHPYEFVTELEKRLPAFGTVAHRIIAIDGYTPHFGFTDSIHLKLTDEVREKGVHWVTSAPSYAGLHSATARAFNAVKAEEGEKSRHPTRPPTVVIYEGCSALVDMESPEQYRIFIRHVLPSERFWGGMLTLFIEPTVRQEDEALLESYVDAFSTNQPPQMATRNQMPQQEVNRAPQS